MSKLLTAGFDKSTNLSHYTTAVVGCSIGAFGRNGTNGLRRTNNNHYVRLPLNSDVSELYIGVAMSLGTVPDTKSAQLLTLYDGGTEKVDIRYNSAGQVTLPGGSFMVPLGAYYYFEFHVVLHDTTGSIVARLNGSEVYNVSNIDTNAGSGTVANMLGLGGNSEGSGGDFGVDIRYDDLVVMDTTGSSMNGFIGDVRVIEQVATGDGDEEDWTLSTGTDMYALLDEVPPSESDYIEADTAGNKALFTFPSLPIVAGVVHCSDIEWFGRKTDAGTRTVRGLAKQGGVEGSAAAVSLSDTNTYGYGHFPLNPATSAQWTIAEVNSAQHGVEVAS